MPSPGRPAKIDMSTVIVISDKISSFMSKEALAHFKTLEKVTPYKRASFIMNNFVPSSMKNCAFMVNRQFVPLF